MGRHAAWAMWAWPARAARAARAASTLHPLHRYGAALCLPFICRSPGQNTEGFLVLRAAPVQPRCSRQSFSSSSRTAERVPTPRPSPQAPLMRRASRDPWLASAPQGRLAGNGTEENKKQSEADENRGEYFSSRGGACAFLFSTTCCVGQGRGVVGGVGVHPPRQTTGVDGGKFKGSRPSWSPRRHASPLHAAPRRGKGRG